MAGDMLVMGEFDAIVVRECSTGYGEAVRVILVPKDKIDEGAVQDLAEYGCQKAQFIDPDLAYSDDEVKAIFDEMNPPAENDDDSVFDEERVSKAFKPHTLVSYKGGGYDGCFWEWNYAYIDQEGHFHDVFSSGHRGCKTLKDLEAYYQTFQTATTQWHALKKREDAGEPVYPSGRRPPDDFDLYDLNSDEEKLRMGREMPIDHLIGVTKALHELEQPVDVSGIKAVCDCCGETFAVLDATGEDPRGIGGIAIANHKIVCHECESSGTCSNCTEYVGKDNIVNDDSDYCGFCTWCRDSAKAEDDKQLAEEQARLIAQGGIPPLETTKPAKGQKELKFRKPPRKRNGHSR